ncbi:protein MAIN-LIKE 2-like [Vicia villosa]|uniref:protein MAIN-LIKE 2-like n=1 Tax=Vicia villosa TaxID=3911 RepID=UPI00273B919B|nr:protein MAIN-LIKE 2-like [Vicia villosa]
MDDAPARSSSASRSRRSQASSSREEEAREDEEKERATIKFVNHARKIFDLFKPHAQWFNDVVVGSGLGGLCMTRYSTISHDMQWAFAERWHKETSSFHLLVGELMITLHDVTCLLHLPIRGRLLDHSGIQRVEAIEWMVDYLGMDPNMADYECGVTSGAHIRFSSLKDLYENHLVEAAESEEEGDGVLLSITVVALYGVGSCSW